MSGALATTSAYIQPTEMGAYGLLGVDEKLIAQACALIDILIKRPMGAMWAPDYAGWPCYMSRVQPLRRLTIAGGIPAGNAVVVPVPGMLQSDSDSLIGEVFIIDRDNPSLVEACTVQTAQAGQVTLYNVQLDHPGPATMDQGMAIMEERSLPDRRTICQVSQWPIGRLLSGVGRYGYGRRSEQMLGYFDDVNLFSMFQTFGGPPLWEFFETQASSIAPETAVIWIPAGRLMSYFTDVKLRYVAGWPATAIPEGVKQATAALTLAIRDKPLPGNIISYKAGDTAITRALASLLDVDTTRMISRYSAFTFV